MKRYCKRAKGGNGTRSVGYIILDCSILDLQERSAKSLSFPNARSAGEYLGLSHNRVPFYTSKAAIVNKIRYYSEKHKKEFAIRIDKKKPT